MITIFIALYPNGPTSERRISSYINFTSRAFAIILTVQNDAFSRRYQVRKRAT